MVDTNLMFKTRPCGCKGLRSCKVCEANHGAWNLQKEVNLPKEEGLLYCSQCKALWPGWNTSDLNLHPNHEGTSLSFSGIELIPDFITESEEEDLLKKIDEVPWDTSQSGRYKQNYGPKCNFKKRKVRDANFSGYPLFTKFIQERFKTAGLLANFKAVEQCSLDYSEDRGSSIDPHIDDCWIWGERIPTLNLLSDCILTLTKFKGPITKYNLTCSFEYPRVVDDNGIVKNGDTLSDDHLKLLALKSENINLYCDNLDSVLNALGHKKLPDIIRVPMPRRSLIVLYSDARYYYEHSILREDISDRRVCITYRELTPPYLENGDKESVGKEILKSSSNFWSHAAGEGS